jgi:hypothetical protein
MSLPLIATVVFPLDSGLSGCCSRNGFWLLAFAFWLLASGRADRTDREALLFFFCQIFGKNAL